MRSAEVTLVACVLSAAWVWVSWSVPVPEKMGLPSVLLVTLACTSYFALYCLARFRLKLAALPLAICTLTLALLMFSMWGSMIGQGPLLKFPATFPKEVKLSSLFLDAPIAAISVSVVFAYPLAVLLPRLYWLVPALAAAIIMSLQYTLLFDQANRTFIRSLVLYELACLLFLVPYILKLAISKIQASHAEV